MHEIVRIVFASDNNYIKYLAVSICSLIQNASSDTQYDIYIISDNVSEINKRKLLQISKPNINITFIDSAPIMQKYSDINFFVSGHISLATYFRLFILDIFPKYDKIIYADCDVIFNTDIAKLYDINLDNYYIAAVPDIGLIYESCVQTIDSDYFHKQLNISDITKYFNAGIICFNLKELREQKIAFIDTLKWLTKPRYHDQCVLNTVCAGHVKYLDFQWNYWGNLKTDTPEYKTYFPKQYLSEFEKASADPFIIHGKPWIYPDSEFAHLFFAYARMTPFYESILYANLKPVTPSVAIDMNYIRKKYNKYKLANLLTFGMVGRFRHNVHKYYNILNKGDKK